jgi:hypothetical protein
VSRHKFAPEVHQFIRENVEGRTCCELVALVNEHFGEELFTECSMRSYKKNHGLKSGTPRGNLLGSSVKWPPQVGEYIVEVAEGRSREEITRLVNARFGAGTMTQAQVDAYMCRNKIRSGVDCRFRPGGTPFNKGRKGWHPPGCEKTWFPAGQLSINAAPIGTEQERDDGYVYVKLRDGHGMKNWMQKHRMIWEQAHGQIPPGSVVIFLNGNRRDFRLENLQMVSRAENAVMCKRGLHSSNPEFTKTGILVAKVVLAQKKAREVHRKKE